jgi:quinolinate synthase
MARKGECPICRKIIIEDIEKYKEEYPEEKEIQCPYCLEFIKI